MSDTIAVVARTTDEGLVYLAQPLGKLGWASTEQGAATFQSTREATRAASQLPAKLRAFALPARHAA